MKRECLFATVRILLGLIFLWAFLDKAFGLGFATTPEKAWINGGSPTYGFLSGVKGPFAMFYNDLAGQGWVDVLFMLGLLGIGLSLVLGIGLTIAAYSGGLLMLLMWSASLPLKTNPIIDDHIIYLVVLFLLASVKAGRYYGFGKQWSKTKLVKQHPIL